MKTCKHPSFHFNTTIHLTLGRVMGWVLGCWGVGVLGCWVGCWVVVCCVGCWVLGRVLGVGSGVGLGGSGVVLVVGCCVGWFAWVVV